MKIGSVTSTNSFNLKIKFYPYILQFFCLNVLVFAARDLYEINFNIYDFRENLCNGRHTEITGEI